eukprot:CAMPEP_0116145452 /NCGR_PEP_ID=MMETSP0329-20121206/16599_1 /TAXON_ID=697910 /ORGANISM="Pseudo-nitzschia arenysensis, Strain B593" /LENGTH=337 /DNA_ID=CAMNT_0003641055 /DNA_START=140 /DNA_END=1153 /DNA_ORIENTATION=+
MAPVIIQPRETQLDAASSSLKRKNEELDANEAGSKTLAPTTTAPPTKLLTTAYEKEQVILKTYDSGATASAATKKARETRLEQNRKAARESRRRKKVMIEDLQRSVIFFSRANGTLKHQNDDLTRLLMQAQAQVSVIESTNNSNSNATTNNNTTTPAPVTTTPSTTSTATPAQQPQTQAGPSTNKTPAPAAPLTTATAAAAVYPPVPAMQPGATMQAMASFQQAAAAAMQVAVQGMQGISPGASLQTLAQPAPTTGSASAQQAFNDTMTALAMQQAAIAAAAVPPHLMAQIVGTTPAYGAPAVAISAAPTAAGTPIPVVPWPSMAAPVTQPQGAGEF